MSSLSDKKIIGALITLSIAQVIGWGTISLPAIIGRQMAADLHMKLPAVFAGTSTFYVTMGLCSPCLARPFVRCGARRVMVAGTLVAAPGFLLLSIAQGPILYFSAWVILGVAGSASLSTASYIALHEIAGRYAQRAIGALMLVNGLSSSVFWPITSLITEAAGWRTACLVYAALMLLVSAPFYAFGLPDRRFRANEPAQQGTAPLPDRIPQRSTFYLITAATGLNAVVTLGLSAVLIELLKTEGLPPSQALAFGSLLGIIQVSARAIDFMGGGRWDAITTGLVATTILAAGILLLIMSGGHFLAIAAFILFFGIGSGALAIVRATMPLVFYDRAEFARASSHMALPLNLISAASPPILAEILVRFDSRALLELTLLLSCGAFASLAFLRGRRPRLAVEGVQNGADPA
ncbi:MFS transporter [Bradyrhizobium centrolobii]|uniref:MFS transporter n=1 Tax=Bradyrhizobium centrolobii TaxID=1505087 RepID=A0A176ZB83_9BRAD|nr:MFS transporter [Bradyrhizobium centrolobii]OAF17046.1 MFS transporter [Bradyrhizobium centrolobii]